MLAFESPYIPFVFYLHQRSSLCGLKFRASTLSFQRKMVFSSLPKHKEPPSLFSIWEGLHLPFIPQGQLCQIQNSANSVFFQGPQTRHPTVFWASEFLTSNGLLVSLKTLCTPRPFSLPGFKSLPFFGFSSENILRLWADLGVSPYLKLTALLGNVDSCLLPSLGCAEAPPLPIFSLPFSSLSSRRGCCTSDAPCGPRFSSFSALFFLLLRLGNVIRPISKFAEFFFSCSHLPRGPSRELHFHHSTFLLQNLCLVTFGHFCFFTNILFVEINSSSGPPGLFGDAHLRLCPSKPNVCATSGMVSVHFSP